MKVLVYDIEIAKAICGRNEERLPNVEYCDGWHDHEGMGISVVGAMEIEDFRLPIPHVYCQDNRKEFQAAINSADALVTFNGVKFDDVVLRKVWGIDIPEGQSVDILREMWIADGLDPDRFSPKTHGGYSLDATAQANGIGGKSGHGALAPVQWQRGEYGSAIDYCLRDVWLTATLALLTRAMEPLVHPKDPTRKIRPRWPVAEVAR